MSRGQYESLFGDELFPSALYGLPETEQIIWESMIYGESRANIEAFRDEIMEVGFECGPVSEDSPKADNFSFTYRISTTVANAEWLASKLGDLYDIEKKYVIQGATFSLKSQNGKALL